MSLIENCVSCMSVLSEEKKSREAWQKGCEAMINRLNARINELEGSKPKKENPSTMVFFDMAMPETDKSIYTQIIPKLKPYQRTFHEQLQKFRVAIDKKKSQKHLEKCLKDRNEQIRVLESKLKFSHDAIQSTLLEYNELKEKNSTQSSSIENMFKQIDELKDSNKYLQEMVGDREKEIARYIAKVKELMFKLDLVRDHNRKAYI